MRPQCLLGARQKPRCVSPNVCLTFQRKSDIGYRLRSLSWGTSYRMLRGLQGGTVSVIDFGKHLMTQTTKCRCGQKEVYSCSYGQRHAGYGYYTVLLPRKNATPNCAPLSPPLPILFLQDSSEPRMSEQSYPWISNSMRDPLAYSIVLRGTLWDTLT